MRVSRRQALRLAGAAALAPVGALVARPAAGASPAPPIRLAVSTYSYWHFRTEKYPIEKVIEEAAALVSTAWRSCTGRWPAKIRPT